MSDTPTEPPPTGTGADAPDVGRARDQIENAAEAVFIAALAWYALHGDEEPDEESFFARTASRLAHIMWKLRPRLSASKPPKSTAEDRDRWVDEQSRQIVTETLEDAGAHYGTVFRRMTRADPLAKEPTVRSTFRMDHAWAKAAARTAATRLAAETAIGMRPDVEAFTGEPHNFLWVSRGDPKVRTLHRQLHGRVRPLGTPFHSWPTGQELNYPGDPKAPLDATINCRCGLMLVPAKDAKDAEAVFHVPDADFDVPMAASGHLLIQAEHDLRAEKMRRMSTSER